MKKITHIAIGLFAITNHVYEIIDVQGSVYLSILYFFILYASISAICVKEWFFTKEKYFAAMGLGLGVRAVLELKGIGMDYKQYLNMINDYEKTIFFSFFIITILIKVVYDNRNN